jgi:hypothetical protein
MSDILTVLNRIYRGKTLKVTVPFRVHLTLHIEKVVEIGEGGGTFYLFVYSKIEQQWLNEPHEFDDSDYEHFGVGSEPEDIFYHFAEELVRKFFGVESAFQRLGAYLYWNHLRKAHKNIIVKEYHEQG